MLRYVNGLVRTDSQSFHREIKFHVPPKWKEDDSHLTVELSLPKLWYGHNVHLLYDWRQALELLREKLNEQFKLRTNVVLPSVHTWILNRVDICYAWRFPNQSFAQSFLDSLKCVRFPYKKPVIYPTTILFRGTTYSFKVYLKHPEFRKHDLKALIKQKCSLEWINHIERMAEGVLRAEATLRRQYLRDKGVTTVADLTASKTTVLFERWQAADNTELAMVLDWMLFRAKADGLPLSSAPLDGFSLDYEEAQLRVGDRVVNYPGGKAVFSCVEMPTYLMQTLLTKYVGSDPAMRKVDKVQQVLMTHYKPVKAGRLTSFWLYVKEFGETAAIDVYGRDSFYRSKRDLKKAGVSLLEPPSKGVVVELDATFIEDFRMSVPSAYVTNRYDDFRDSENILNLNQYRRAEA